MLSTEAGIYISFPAPSMGPGGEWRKSFFPIVSASGSTSGFNNNLSKSMNPSSSWSYDLYLANSSSWLGK